MSIMFDPKSVVNACKLYVDAQGFVFKSCENKYIVVMSYLPTTLTNERRDSIVNDQFAKCRASELFVEFIVDMFDTRIKPRRVVSKYKKIKTIYEVGKSVRPDTFDEDINNVYSNGIHYYKKIYPAIYYDPDISLNNYTGFWKSWYTNGQIECECNYENGKLTGDWKRWHYNGKNYEAGTFLKGTRYGKWIFFDRLGQKIKEGSYIDDKETGIWTIWNYVHSEYWQGYYHDGKKCGTWSVYNIPYYYEANQNNVMLGEGEMVDDVLSGDWTFWHKYNKCSCVGNFIDGVRSGPWKKKTNMSCVSVQCDICKECDNIIDNYKKLNLFIYA